MKLYYYVASGGDGSVSVNFCESEELAQWLDDDWLDWAKSGENDWAETSVGSIDVDGVNSKLQTKHTVLLDYLFDYRFDVGLIYGFLEKFFNGKLPIYKYAEEITSNGYKYFHFTHDDQYVSKQFVGIDYSYEDRIAHVEKSLQDYKQEIRVGC